MRDFLFSNMKLKALALIFASALWFFVAGQSNTEVGFFVPLGFKSAPKDMVMSLAPADEIEVRVMGPKFFINNLSPSQIIAEIDLSGAKEGLNTFRLQPKDVVTPMGINVLKIRPSSIDVKMERLVRLDLPVKPVIIGKPAEGYSVAEVAVSPRMVQASGVGKEAREAVMIATKPIDISGLSYSRSFQAQLDGHEYEFRNLAPERVDVRVNIKKSEVNRR